MMRPSSVPAIITQLLASCRAVLNPSVWTVIDGPAWVMTIGHRLYIGTDDPDGERQSIGTSSFEDLGYAQDETISLNCTIEVLNGSPSDDAFSSGRAAAYGCLEVLRDVLANLPSSLACRAAVESHDAYQSLLDQGPLVVLTVRISMSALDNS